MIYKGEIPFVRMLIPLIIGIAFAYHFPSRYVPQYWVSATAFFLVLLTLFLFFYKRYKLFRLSWVAGIIIQFILFSTGAGLTADSSKLFDSRSFAVKESDYLSLRLMSEPSESKGIIRVEAEVLQGFNGNEIYDASGNLLVLIKRDDILIKRLKYGDVLIVPAKFSKVSAPFNPGEFDYRRYLNNRKIYHQAFYNSNEIRLIRRNSGNPVIAFALQLRFNCVERINRFIENMDAAALASALILGYRSDLSSELVNAYSDTGTMHVLSVSGMHVGIVFLVLNTLLKPLNRGRYSILLRVMLIVGFIWFYALLTGFSASVCRAALMLSFVVIGKGLNKQQNTYNLIAISAFFLLLYDPWYLFDVGFQLSYLAVCGLIYFQPILYHLLCFRNRLADLIWSYSALSLAAQIATFPLSIYYFHQFPVYFLISNLLIVLPVAVIMYAGIVFMLLPFSSIESALGQFLNYAIIYTNKILFSLEKLPAAVLTGLWINIFELLLISLIVLLTFWTFTLRSKIFLWCTLIFTLALSISLSLKSIRNFNRNELVLMSLRSNYAIVWLNQGKATVITDLNVNDKTFDYSIRPMIESMGCEMIHFTNNTQSFSGLNVKLDENLKLFGNVKLLRWNRDWMKYNFRSGIKINAMLIGDNSLWSLHEAVKRFNVKMFIFESSNSEYRIQKWLKEAQELNIRCYSLKKMPAYVIKLQ